MDFLFSGVVFDETSTSFGLMRLEIESCEVLSEVFVVFVVFVVFERVASVGNNKEGEVEVEVEVELEDKGEEGMEMGEAK